MRNAKFWINKTSNQNIEGFTIVHQGYEIDVFCFRGEEIIQILF
jgi:hypothetical protein